MFGTYIPQKNKILLNQSSLIFISLVKTTGTYMKGKYIL